MKQKLHILFLLMALLPWSIVASAEDFDDGTFKYTIISEKYKTVSCDGFTDKHKNDIELDIPYSVYTNNKAYTIKVIAEGAFKDCSNLVSIEVPSNVESIENYAFNGCTALKNIWINDSKTELKLGYNEYISESYGKGLFANCPLEKLYLGRNLNYKSYSDCDSQWGFSPFANTTLADVNIGDNVTDISRQCFRGTKITKIDIPSSVTSIGDMAFMLCDKLENVTLPDNLEVIRGWAFYGCAFTEFTIPNKVKYIGASAFCACTNLKAISIPSSVDKIGEGGSGYDAGAVFTGCNSLVSLRFEDSDKALEYCNHTGNKYIREFQNAKDVYLGRNIEMSRGNYNFTSIQESSFFKYIENITISVKVTKLPDYLLEYCEYVKSVRIPQSVTYIGYHAFYGCPQIGKIICEPYTAPSTYNICESDRYPQITLLTQKNTTGYDEDIWSQFKRPKITTITDNNSSVEPDIYSAGYITYARQNLQPSTYATFCLPFTTDLSDVADKFEAVYTTNGTALYKPDGKLILMLKKIGMDESIPAGQAFVGKLCGTVTEVTFANNTITTTNENTMQNPEPQKLEVYDWNGTSGLLTENTDISVSYGGALTTMPGKGSEYETFNSNGTFGSTADGTVKAFRAYVVKNNTAAMSKVRSISLGIDDETTGINIITATTAVPADNAIYSIDGTLVRTNGNTEGLPSGVYIKNHKKIIIK